MTNTSNLNNEELKHRILARKLELEAKLEHLKADTTAKTADARKNIQKDLDELGGKIETGWEESHRAHSRVSKRLVQAHRPELDRVQMI